MSESDNRSVERVTDPNRSSESYVRTDERTNEELGDRGQIPDPPNHVREKSDEIDSNSPPENPPHPRDMLAHQRKPGPMKVRAALRTAGARIRKEVPRATDEK